jgi:hypothetical protein
LRIKVLVLRFVFRVLLLKVKVKVLVLGVWVKVLVLKFQNYYMGLYVITTFEQGVFQN